MAEGWADGREGEVLAFFEGDAVDVFELLTDELGAVRHQPIFLRTLRNEAMF